MLGCHAIAYGRCEYDDGPCNRCGNCLEPEELLVCMECSGSIYEGDEYRELGGMQFCEECVSKGYRTASADMLPY